MNRAPAYDLRPSTIGEVRHLFAEHHGYRSTGSVAVYCFAVYESGAPAAAFLWQPPPPQAAHAVCPELPHGVLALSRMVAVPSNRRRFRLRNPLRRQMRALVDRTRWPVLVTYSDEGQGHDGHIYKISGWTKTERHRARTVTIDGRRVSRYADGATVAHDGAVLGWTWIQRWEHRVPNPVGAFDAAWERVPVPGKFWRSGAQAHTYRRRPCTSS